MTLSLMVVLFGLELFVLGLALSPLPWLALLVLGLLVAAAGVFFTPMVKVGVRK